MPVLTIAGLAFPHTVSGGGWWFSSLIDWYAVPESKTPLDPRPLGAHGAFGAVMDWRGSLAISFTIRYLGQATTDALMALAAVKAKLAPGAQVVMSFDDGLGPTERVVSVRAVDVPDMINKPFVEAVVHVVATNPLRYGTPVTASTGIPTAGTGMGFPFAFPAEFGTPGISGRVTVTNAGNADTDIVYDVVGPSGGFSVIDVLTAREVRFERVIPDGSVVHVDGRTGRAWIDDPQSDVSGFLTRTDFTPVPAGSPRQLQFNTIGGGSPVLTVTTRPAWW